MSEKPTEAAGLPKRWSARRKSEVLLRLLRGEDIGEASREIRVPPPELERWAAEVPRGGLRGPEGRTAPDGELMRTRVKLGEMTLRVELQAELLENKGGRGRTEKALAARGRRRVHAGQARSEDGVGRRGSRRGDPDGAVGESVRGRGALEGEGAPGGQGDRRGPRPPARLGFAVPGPAFQAEIRWLGIRSTPAYVGEPECNGVVERFIHTLKRARRL